MSLPVVNVLIALLGLLLVGGIALQARRFGRHRRQRLDRQQLEDALKHLFEQEYRGRHGSLSSLAGVLHIPDSAAVGLVARLQALDMVVQRGQELGLTPEGQRLALQVVRAHRLLERYFADEARLPLKRIHAEAERREHTLSPDEVERLSAFLGHPMLDPHGDPIPTRDGVVAPASGTPATSWPPGARARVVHLEDEPEISYAQIVAAGLTVGQQVQVLESTPERVILADGEHEFRLAPVVAANVFLAPAAEPRADTGVIRLADLVRRRPALVVGLDDACQGYSRRRLMDLGFTEGARVRPSLSTFAGDPRAYEVRGTLVALRREQAAQVLVSPVDDEASGAAAS